MSDGYAVVRSSTLAWLLEAARVEGELRDVPEAVAVDLGARLERVEVPEELEDRLAAVGPLLSFDEHVELLVGDPDLELPKGDQGSQFWKLVTRIALSILRNEAEAVQRVIAERT